MAALTFEASDTGIGAKVQVLAILELDSSRLLTIVDDLFELSDNFGVVFLFPCVVCSLDALLHLLKRLLEHL